MWELIDRIEDQHPTSQYIPAQVANRPSYLFELIKYEYKRNNRIERFMNPVKSFPIDQSYINLAIVETKDQQEKEKKLRDSQHNDAIMEAFENIHGTKTPIDIKNIFKTCKDQTRNVLVFGRAGIGKSTFCQYIAYQWATGVIWQEYELIALIPLRSLTEDNYPILPAGTNYSLIDVLRKECFSFDQYLSEKDETQLQEQFHNSRILWLLDGYDEIAQNVPTHLKSLLNDQLLKTPHHIITSRPYMNTLSHFVQLEITGFTDDNISRYVKQFFEEIENEAQNSSAEDEKILSFFKRNRRIWGIAHIPINLELICSVWSNTDWATTKTMTMTTLYDEITEWVCRRYLIKQKGLSIEELKLKSKSDIYEDCKIELAFLESTCEALGRIGEKAATKETCEALGRICEKAATPDVIAALMIALGDTVSIVRERACVALCRMGERTPTPDVIAALVTALGDVNEWIRSNACKVLGRICEKAATPDVIAALIIALGDTDDIVRERACVALGQMGEKAATKEVIAALVTTLGDVNAWIRSNAYEALGRIGEIAPTHDVILVLLTALEDVNIWIRSNACKVLSRIGEKAATPNVIAALMIALGDTANIIRERACVALGQMGEKAATPDVIAALMSTMEDSSDIVRLKACEALGLVGVKAETKEEAAEMAGAQYTYRKNYGGVHGYKYR
ncbi:unnamed protein product [Adineta steineri]|uniref:NACHT domain-containing protein n=1 Tax=Adineta steineri TaxID=433720 RepID=A0A819AS02_9BILA|nr:unnamed protein product [Adineta steineri]